jgi:proton glutamate symport protein
MDLLFVLRWAAIAALVVYAARQRSLTGWILVSMVVGAEIGHDFPQVAVSLRVISQIFLRLIRTIVAPLLFATLVVGIAGHSNLRQVGRMGVKALIYFEIVTTLALFIGWAAITISRAGVGITLPPPPAGTPIQQTAARTWQEIVLEAFPENFARSVVEAQMLQIVVFSVIFGVALALIEDDKRRPMLAFAESLAETMFRFTRIVMLMAPLGVGAAIAYTVGQLGVGILVNLAQLVGHVRRGHRRLSRRRPAARGAHRARAAPTVRASRGRTGLDRIRDHKFRGRAAAGDAGDGANWRAASDRGVRDADLGTASISMAARCISRCCAIFVAQAAGIALTVGQQFVLLLTLMLSSKGVAGVPRGALVVLLGTVAGFGLPVEPVLVILGIDAVLDMFRTSLNVLGNCLATVVIARWEGEFVD